MKLIKKFMIVPYVETKNQLNDKEKIKNIIDNKYINSEEKLKLIKNIQNKYKKNDDSRANQEILQNDKVDNQIHEAFNKGIEPGRSEPLQNTFEYDYSEFDDIKNKSELNEEGLDQSQSNINIGASEYNERVNELMETDKTFKNDYDYLPPFEQTRSKSDEDRSFLNLTKQKKFKFKKPNFQLGQEQSLQELLKSQTNKRKPTDFNNYSNFELSSKKPIKSTPKINKINPSYFLNESKIDFTSKIPEDLTSENKIPVQKKKKSKKSKVDEIYNNKNIFENDSLSPLKKKSKIKKNEIELETIKWEDYYKPQLKAFSPSSPIKKNAKNK